MFLPRIIVKVKYWELRETCNLMSDAVVRSIIWSDEEFAGTPKIPTTIDTDESVQWGLCKSKHICVCSVGLVVRKSEWFGWCRQFGDGERKRRQHKWKNISHPGTRTMFGEMTASVFISHEAHSLWRNRRFCLTLEN